MQSEESAAIKEAEELLMARNHLTEGEVHRYLQKCSVDSGTNMAETAFMVLSMMKQEKKYHLECKRQGAGA